jgi:hypothetical protein
MCECGDYDPPEFLRERRVKANKPHECCECLQTIEKGETYQNASGKWDGRLETFRTCLGCLDLAKRLGVTCWCFGMLMDELDPRDADSPEIEDWRNARHRRWSAIEAGSGVAVKEVVRE